ncbi:hypothetical protein JCM11251_001852 [Rhodosporidiobolus azoricus]
MSFSPSEPLAWQRKPSSPRRWFATAGVASVLLLSWFAWPGGAAVDEAEAAWLARKGKGGALSELQTADPSQPCKRTLVLDWDSWSIGIGSGLMTLNGAAVWADNQGFEVLVSKGTNNYGKHEEYFETPTPSCVVKDEGAYNPWPCRDGKEGCSVLFNRTTGERLEEELPERTALGVWSLYPVNPVNRWISTTLYDFKSLEGLPPFDSQKPLPRLLSVPPAMQNAYDRMQRMFNHIFKLNKGMEDLVDQKAQALDLQKPTKNRVPVVGVHFRAGDKMLYECRETARMSCANVTLHIEGALQQLDYALSRSTFLPPTTSPTGQVTNKPKLVLLTAEADAFDSFRQVNDDKFQGVFEIVKAPDVTSDASQKEKSFAQQKFNSLPLEARIADTRDLLSNVAMLAKRADGFVVSANTNIGRVASLMAERPFAVSTLDFWWHPTLFLLSYPDCTGVGVCYPK